MQWTCHKCDSTIIGYKPEHCTICHETFTSTTSGDMHRVGDHGVKTGTNRRRYLTVDEMEAKGMQRNKLGYWTSGGTSYWAKEAITPSQTTFAHTN